MGAVRTLLGFGFGVFICGVFLRLGKDIYLKYIAQYIYDNSDPYYLASDVLWNSLPYVIIFVGIVCLVLGGLLGHGSKTVVYE